MDLFTNLMVALLKEAQSETDNLQVGQADQAVAWNALGVGEATLAWPRPDTDW